MDDWGYPHDLGNHHWSMGEFSHWFSLRHEMEKWVTWVNCGLLFNPDVTMENIVETWWVKLLDRTFFGYKSWPHHYPFVMKHGLLEHGNPLTMLNDVPIHRYLHLTMIFPWSSQLSTSTNPGRIQTSPGVEEVGNSPTAPWFPLMGKPPQNL